jgi:hypothetical protein
MAARVVGAGADDGDLGWVVHVLVRQADVMSNSSRYDQLGCECGAVGVCAQA